MTAPRRAPASLGSRRGRSHPPGRAFPPAGFLQSGAAEGVGAEGPRGPAGLVPGFLSTFPEQDRPGDGTQHKRPSWERSQEIASWFAQVPPLSGKVPIAVRNLLVLTHWV